MMRTRRFVLAEKAEKGQNSSNNPMLNDVILENFFAVIPFRCEDFQNFRLVSKQWFKASLPRWRQNAWLSIRDYLHNSCLSIKLCEEMITMAGDPFGLLGVNHFRKYTVRLVKNMSYAGHFHHGKGRFHFWTILGPLMTHLKVIGSKILSREEVQRILFEMTPNLEFFSYEKNRIFEKSTIPLPLTEIEWRGVTEPVWNDLWIPQAAAVRNNLTHLEVCLKWDFPLAWVYYLSRFPNIKILKLAEFMDTYRLGSFYDELPLFFKSIKCIRERCNPEHMRNLQQLDILNASIRPLRTLASILSVLLELAFPLTVLALDIGYEAEESEDTLKKLLALYARTLKKLVVFRGVFLKPFQRTFPYGVNLSLLSELIFIGPICHNLNFLVNTPHLRVLVILDGSKEVERRVLHSYIDFSLSLILDKLVRSRKCCPIHPVIANTNFREHKWNNVVLPKLKELIVGHQLCSGEQVEQLGKIMPNLKKLRIGLDNSGFTNVCRIWKGLEHLDIEPFDVSEEGLLGTVCGQMYCEPNLTDFKYLTYFGMGNHSRIRDEAKLSNNSILCGLFVTTSLKEVSISVYPKDYRAIRAKLFSRFPQA